MNVVGGTLARIAVFPVDCMFCVYDVFAVGLRKTGALGKNRKCYRDGVCRSVRKYTNEWLFRLVVCPKADAENETCRATRGAPVYLLRGILGLTVFALVVVGVVLGTGLYWSRRGVDGARAGGTGARDDRAIAELEACMALADQARSTGNYSAALHQYHKALQLSPGLKEAEFRMGLCLQKMGNEAIARKYFRRASSGPSGVPDAAARLADSLYRIGQVVPASEAAERAFKLGAKTAPIHAMLAELALIKDDMEGAQEHLSRAVKRNSQDEIVRTVRVKMLLRRGKIREALSFMDDVEKPISLPTWRLCRIWLLQYQGKPEEAYSRLKQLLEEYTGSALAHVWMVELLFAGGEHEKAIAKTRDLTRSFPMPDEQKLRLARVLQSYGQAGHALELALDLTRSTEAGESAHLLAGDIYMDEELPLRAQWHATRALDINPGEPHALTLAGRVAYAEGQHMEARRNLKTAVERAPGYAPAHFMLGLTEYAIKDLSLAAASLKRACELAPEVGEYHYYHGRALAGSGQEEEAAAELTRAAELMGDPHLAWTDLGMLAEKRGDAEDAMRFYRKAVEANPARAVVAYNNLASHLLSTNRTIPLALALAHTAQALSSTSHQGATSDTYAEALVRAGFAGAAVRPARLAAAAHPESAAIQIRLGLAEAAAGNRERAISILERAEQLATTEQMQARATELLRQVKAKPNGAPSTEPDETRNGTDAD
jgi:tetratricopeptide (TPR) repeat protein